MNKGKLLLLGSVGALVLLSLLLFHHASRSVATSSGTPSTGTQSTLLVYCAAGVKQPLVDAARQYEQRYGVQVQLQYGGSGTLLSNLQVSGSGDLYISADHSYQEIAREKGLVQEVVPLAKMKPVIAVRKGNPKNIATLKDLIQPEMRLSLANPEAASIGKQTRILLEKAGLWSQVKEQVERKGVFKPTVPELANDVKIGATDAAIVWDATVNQYPDLEMVDVPEWANVDKEISIGVLTCCKQPTQALRFARFLNSTEVNPIFRKHGYRSVAGDAWSERPELTFFSGSVNRRSVEDTVKAFGLREGVTVNIVFNGCGILTAQMKTIQQEKAGIGFPDVYMACDRYYLDTVADWFQEDMDVSETPIVIVVPKGNPKGIKTLKDLTREGIRVAVGQPDQCTIGVLTRKLLDQQGVLDGVMKNVLTQTASSAMLVPTVTTNSVDACLAYRTDARAEANRVETVEIDAPGARAIQPIAIARSSNHKYLSRRLVQAILSARDKFESAGFIYRAGRKEAPAP